MRNKKLKIRYRCRNCGTLNQTGWKSWSINCKPVRCKNCRTLNYFISKKINYFKHLAFIPSKYFKVYRKFIDKQKELKKQLYAQIQDKGTKIKAGRRIARKLKNAFERICYLASIKEHPTLKGICS